MQQVAVTRAQAIAFRWRAHQLGRAAGSTTSAADVDLLDYGVQDTGPDGAAWALAVRGADIAAAELAYAWTVRGAPHAYRRADLAAVAVATAPYSEADAAKRIYDAAKPLKAAGIPVLEALGTVAAAQRDIVATPTVKGAMSAALTARLPAPYLRNCRPCNATHVYEMPFRLAALQAGLELDAGTSPPVLRRIARFRPAPYARLAGEAEARVDVVRNYLRFFGPASPRTVAAFLDAPVKDVSAHWPPDAVPVSLDGADGVSVLEAHLPELTAKARRAQGVVRLVGPYDPYLQLRDRATIVPADRHKALWPVLGRPGAILRDGELIGIWRPRTSGRKLTLQVEAWQPWNAATERAVAAECERLAAFRDVAFAGVSRTGAL